MPERTRHLYGQVTEDKVLHFIELWMTVLAHMARYSKTNRLVAKNLRLLHDSLPELIAEPDALEFREFQNMLFVNGAPLNVAATKAPAVSAFVFLLLRHDMRVIRLRRGVTLDEFGNLLECLSRTPTEDELAGCAADPASFGPHIEVEQHVAPGAAPPAKPREPIPGAFMRPTSPLSELPSRITAHSGRPEPASAEMVAVRVVVRVGQQALYGAEVHWAGQPESAMLTDGENGAVLEAPAGAHEMLIRYDEYQMRRLVEVKEPNQIVEIDLQQVFEYEGD
jgi:hypothetical protein